MYATKEDYYMSGGPHLKELVAELFNHNKVRDCPLAPDGDRVLTKILSIVAQ